MEQKLALAVKPYTIPKQIEFNFDELKTALTEKVRDYEIAVYTDEQIKEAKEDRASLNKLKKAINDARIKMEKEYMVPFTEFKGRINEIISIIDKPIGIIDAQVKEYEERQKQEKAEAIQQYLNSYKLPYGMKLERIFEQKWLNASVSMKAVKDEIDNKVTAISSDIEILEGLDEFQSFAIQVYAETFSLRDALDAVKKQKEFLARQEKIEAERKAAEQKKTEEVRQPVIEEPKKADEPKKAEGQWIDFSAYLTAETAKALKDFLQVAGIPFRRIITK